MDRQSSFDAVRIRTIKPEFWANEKMSALPDFARLLAIGLLNYADDHGLFWANSLMIRGSLFPFEEDASKIKKGLAQLEAEGFIRLAKTADGRDVGHVIKFSVHQRVDKPQESKIQPLVTFQDQSTNHLGAVVDHSALYRKGKEKEGRGEEGAAAREIARIPESLRTAQFAAAWAKWIEHWTEAFGNRRSMPFHTADAHLQICLKMGPVRAVEAIDTAISKKLREPGLPFDPGGRTPMPEKPRRLPANVQAVLDGAARVTPIA